MKQIYLAVLLVAIIYGLAVLPANARQAIPHDEVYMAPHRSKDFRFSIGGGYAFQTGKVDKNGNGQIGDTKEKLRHGFNVDSDVHYFFRENRGLGLNMHYCSFGTSGNYVTHSDAEQTVGNYSETQKLYFVGPSFAMRHEIPKFLLVPSVAFGPMFYIDKKESGTSLNEFKQACFGLNAGIAGEYILNAKTGVGLKLSYTFGVIYFNSLNIGGERVGMDNRDISNLMLAAFLSFRTR